MANLTSFHIFEILLQDNKIGILLDVVLCFKIQIRYTNAKAHVLLYLVLSNNRITPTT